MARLHRRIEAQCASPLNRLGGEPPQADCSLKQLVEFQNKYLRNALALLFFADKILSSPKIPRNARRRRAGNVGRCIPEYALKRQNENSSLFSPQGLAFILFCKPSTILYQKSWYRLVFLMRIFIISAYKIHIKGSGFTPAPFIIVS